MSLVLTITGHRPGKLGGYKVPNPTYVMVMAGINQALDQYKPEWLITGMALGVDQWTAELCLQKGIKFVAAIPFLGQESKWPPHSQARYQWLLSQASHKEVICDPGYAPWKLQKRNEWMINSCQQVVAVYNGTPGGTANCLAYATQLGKPVHYVPLVPSTSVIDIVDQLMTETELGPSSSSVKKPEEELLAPKVKRIIDL